MTPHDGAPEGRFVDGLLVYGSLENGAIAAKGIWLEPPDLRGASISRLNEWQDRLRAMLALVAPGRRLQVQWSCDSDYRDELERYFVETEKMPEAAVRQVRNERFTRYWARMQARGLRRERLALFLSVEVTAYSGNVRTAPGLEAHYARQVAQLQAEMAEFTESLRRLFAPEALAWPMTEVEHFTYYERFLNPTLADWVDEHPEERLDLDRSIQDNCWLCDGIGQEDGGFHLDGNFHAVLALSRWPQRTRPGIVTHLTGLPFLDYRITVNITPGSAASEIGHEEQAVERLEGEYASDRRHSLLVALRKKERKIENLAGGYARPFLVTYLIRAWDPQKAGLRDKLAAIRAAVHAMDGAQVLECSLPTTARKLFFSSWPGWTHSSYRHRELYAEDAYLADMLPASATFTGRLKEAEAIYDGSHGNLVGVGTFVAGSPQHAVVLGMTGSGKSEFVRDLLLQTAGYFRYTVIIEEGLSHGEFTRRMGEAPVVLHPDAPVTLNYLDTRGLPLTQLQVTSAVALLSRMIGEPPDPERLALRQAQLAQYLHQLYQDAFTDWARREPAAAREAERLALAVERWRERLPAGATSLEAFADLRDRRWAGEDEAIAFVARLDEGEVTRFGREPATARLVPQVACSFYRPEEFPTHVALVELMAYGRFPEHDAEEIGRLATLLRAWCAGGQYGKLFDGVSNLSLERRVVHFELGLIPEHATALKAAAGLLVSGFARQHILSRPREERKCLLYEEAIRLLDIPGGPQLVSEGFAQLRKFGCWVALLLQQYAMLRNSPIRAAVMGNAKQFFFLRQHDQGDLADLAAELALPESAVDAIQHYPMPEQLPEGGKFSSVCLHAPTATPPLCGTLRHIQPCAS
ncbi:MAG: hypothetical protein JSR48_00335 [Verrucomicrobia bacterium]|nr:hypothetical protein [Verrucomicrobiota bacterium]